MSIEDQIIELNNVLIQLRHEYYVMSQPSVDDKVYDAKERELKTLVAENPKFRSLASVLYTVGSDLQDAGGKVKHRKPMLSLNNMYTITELAVWVKEIVDQYPDVWFSVEPKVDGLSCSASYITHKLVKCVTRGDGVYGEDCTQLMAISGAIPTTLRDSWPSGLVEIRGEVWISNGQMAKLNEELEAQGKKPYTSPRNLASGTLKLKDLSEVPRRGLRFYQWDVDGLSQEDLIGGSFSPTRKSHALDYAYRRSGGFAQPLHSSFEGKEFLKNLEHYIDEMRAQREAVWHRGCGMGTDGIVIKVEQEEIRKDLGEDSKYPNWAVSYKFQDSQGVTDLIGIEWFVSRNGRLTPVGVLTPIVLNGATIEKVNLNNASWISEMGITEIPCRVELVRSGDVIPKILRVIDKENA